MKKLIKLEFSRAFQNKGFIVSLGIGILICIWHFWENVYPLRNYVYPVQYPQSSFGKWIGGENGSLQSALYYMLIPILCAMPYAGSYFFDMKTGYRKQLLVRGNKKEYLLSKYLVTFTVGGIISTVPLLFDFVLTGLVLPAVIPQRGTALFPISATMIMADIFYAHPYVYLLLYLLLDAMFFGLLSTIALMAAHFTENRFLVILMPFLTYLFVFSVCQMLAVPQFCPFGFLRPSQPYISTGYIVVGELLLLLVGGGIFLYVGTKKEII